MFGLHRACIVLDELSGPTLKNLYAMRRKHAAAAVIDDLSVTAKGLMLHKGGMTTCVIEADLVT